MHERTWQKKDEFIFHSLTMETCMQINAALIFFLLFYWLLKDPAAPKSTYYKLIVREGGRLRGNLNKIK